MVRLKENAYGSNPSWYIEFQFHNGTIKSARIRIMVNSFFSFNSTMVRLKDPASYSGSTYQYMFQFHNGTIKSSGDGDGKPP